MRPKRLLLPVVLALGAVLPASTAGAAPTATVHGFLLGAVSGLTTGDRPPDGGDFVLGEERLRLDLAGVTEAGEASALVKGDVVHDAVDGETDVDLREAYIGYAADRFELRLGRQILTWGVGDLFFVNDVFPKDWESFFSGRPMEYLKLGVDALRGRFFGGPADADLVVIPFFTPDALPRPDRFVVADPLAGIPSRTEEPEARYGNTEVALRLHRRLAAVDAAAYAYRGFSRTPAVRLDDPLAPSEATRIFPRLSVYGASAQWGFFEAVLSLEAGYYDAHGDGTEKEIGALPSQWRFLAGYQQQLWADFTLGLQAYGERLDDGGARRAAAATEGPSLDRTRLVVSTRLTQLLRYQTWLLTLFAAYSPTDRDYFLQPEVSYRVADNLTVSSGANVFGGRGETFFGRLDASDNVFVRARFDF